MLPVARASLLGARMLLLTTSSKKLLVARIEKLPWDRFTWNRFTCSIQQEAISCVREGTIEGRYCRSSKCGRERLRAEAAYSEPNEVQTPNETIKIVWQPLAVTASSL